MDNSHSIAPYAPVRPIFLYIEANSMLIQSSYKLQQTSRTIPPESDFFLLKKNFQIKLHSDLAQNFENNFSEFDIDFNNKCPSDWDWMFNKGL